MFHRIADWLFEKYEADYYRRAFDKAASAGESVEITTSNLGAPMKVTWNPGSLTYTGNPNNGATYWRYQ